MMLSRGCNPAASAGLSWKTDKITARCLSGTALTSNPDTDIIMFALIFSFLFCNLLRVEEKGMVISKLRNDLAHCQVKLFIGQTS